MQKDKAIGPLLPCNQPLKLDTEEATHINIRHENQNISW
jgi:hypothetical protein